MIVPVRFVSGGQPLQCTTRELSYEGAWVSCPVPPASGSLLSLRVYLPGEVTPEELTAIVRAAVASGEPRHRGFWAEFQPGAESCQERIAQHVTRAVHQGKPPESVLAAPAFAPSLTPPGGSAHPTPSKGAPVLPQNRRSAPRIDSGDSLGVRFATVEEFVLEYAANISAGGVFIRTTSPPPMETKVRVRLELPDGGPPAEANGVVVHQLTVEQAGERREAGMGVAFVEPDAVFISRIERFLDLVLKAKELG